MQDLTTNSSIMHLPDNKAQEFTKKLKITKKVFNKIPEIEE